jgi:N-acetylneuraminate synthase
MKRNKKQTYIIAEAGVNHNGDRDTAFALIDTAAQAGADAVKFQTFKADNLAGFSAPKAAYQKQTSDAKENQAEMLSKLELPRDWHFELQRYAEDAGITFLSTAFDRDSLAFLQELNLPVLKIPSGEVTNGPLLWAFAQTDKPLVLSTGMASLGEVEQALAVIAYGMAHRCAPNDFDTIMRFWAQHDAHELLRQRVTLLHCTSQYPAPPEEVNLNALDTLKNAFSLNIGYSDHTEGLVVATAAVAKGAKIIEKHFTLDRNLPGPDHRASLQPDELTLLVQNIRMLETALGNGVKAPQPSEWDTRQAARQSLIAKSTIEKGQPLTCENLCTSRIGKGISPMQYWDLCGQRAKRRYTAGEPL